MCLEKKLDNALTLTGLLQLEETPDATPSTGRATSPSVARPTHMHGFSHGEECTVPSLEPFKRKQDSIPHM